MSLISHFFSRKPNNSKRRKLGIDDLNLQCLHDTHSPVGQDQQGLKDVIVIDDDEDSTTNLQTINPDYQQAKEFINTSKASGKDSCSSLNVLEGKRPLLKNCPSEIQISHNRPVHDSDNINENNLVNISSRIDINENSNSVDFENEKNKSKSKCNPFAMFAFGHNVSSKTSELDKSPSHSNLSKPITVKNSDRKEITKKKTKEACEFVPMKELSPEKQEEIVKKWHSLIDKSVTNIDDRRFQMLVAARLHARCHETGVRKAMNNLFETIIPFTVQTVATSDPNVISKCIANLQYHNTKAKHIVQAANEILTRFSGKVPEIELELKLLTGIGPVFSDLLAFVNTTEIHNKLAIQLHETETDSSS